MTGKIKREDTTKILCDAVEPLSDVQEHFFSLGALEIRLPGGFKDYSKLKNVLLSAPGNSEVKIGWKQTELSFADEGRAEESRAEMSSLRRLRVLVSEELVEEIERVVGKGNVTVVTRNGIPSRPR